MRGGRNDESDWLEKELLDRANRFDNVLRSIEERRRTGTKIVKAQNYDFDVQVLIDIIHRLAPNERYDHRDCCKSRLDPFAKDIEEVLNKHGYRLFHPAMA